MHKKLFGWEKFICFFSLLREYISLTFIVKHFCKHYLLPFIVRYDFILRLNVCRFGRGLHIKQPGNKEPL